MSDIERKKVSAYFYKHLPTLRNKQPRTVIDLTLDDDDHDVPNIVPVAVEEAKDDEIPNIRDYYSTIDKVYDSDRVYLAPSTLGPNAGLGLFAKINFKDNDYICAYVGVIVATEPYKEFDSDYRLEYSAEYTIDSSDPQSCYGRYANDPIKNVSINARLANRKNVVEACVRATKSIKKDSEIFISYLDDYWKSKQFFKLPEELQKVLLRRNGSEYKEYITNLKRTMGGKLR